jgi:hypothetical protein
MTTSEGNNRVAFVAFISSNVSQGVTQDRKRARRRQEEAGKEEQGQVKAGVTGGRGLGRRGDGRQWVGTGGLRRTEARWTSLWGYGAWRGVGWRSARGE